MAGRNFFILNVFASAKDMLELVLISDQDWWLHRSVDPGIGIIG